MPGAAEPSWTVRPAGPDDRDAAVALMRRAFGDEREEVATARWEWLFAGNTAGTPWHYLVADAGDRLAAQYATMPVRAQHDGEPTLALLSLHTATDPDFERRGLFTGLARQVYEEAADEAPIVFGFPNPSSAPGFYRKLEWVELRPFPLLVRPLGRVGELAAAARPRLAPAARALRLARPLLDLSASPRLRRGRGARVTALDGFGPWADELWQELAPSLGTCAVRDAAYLEWRFCRGPFSYRRYALERSGDPVGFAVTTLATARGVPVAYLMELMAAPDDVRGARLLLANALADAARDGAAAVYAIATSRHPHHRTLRRAGFLAGGSLGTTFSFGVRRNGPAARPDALFHVDDWYLSGADLDYL